MQHKELGNANAYTVWELSSSQDMLPSFVNSHDKALATAWHRNANYLPVKFNGFSDDAVNMASVQNSASKDANNSCAWLSL